MLLGILIDGPILIVGGLSVFALLVFQILVGLRKVKFKGPLHWKVHRYTAYAMVVVALGHAISALAFLGII